MYKVLVYRCDFVGLEDETDDGTEAQSLQEALQDDKELLQKVNPLLNKREQGSKVSILWPFKGVIDKPINPLLNNASQIGQ